MIVPIQVPPGVYRNGTEYQAKGRWRDTNLVRWHEGAMRPIGGWDAAAYAEGFYTDTGLDPTTLGSAAAGGVAWRDNSGNKWALASRTLGAIVYDVGNERSYALTGALTSGAWSWDTFGEIPIGCSSGDGRLLEWDLNTSNNLTAVTNAPTGCYGVFVADERFIFALGDGGDRRSIRWCDREDRTVWTPAATNQAGGRDLDTDGEILLGLQMRGEVLIVTTTDCWSATYIGYPDVWAFKRIGSCTCLGPNAASRSGDAAYWMGDGQFYRYQSGYVQTIPCDISDYVFGQLDRDDGDLAFAWDNHEFGEVWFHYSDGSVNAGPTYAAVLNTKDGSWGTHSSLEFSGVIPKGVLDNPLAIRHSVAEAEYDFSTDPGFTLGTNWQISGGTLNQSTPTSSTASVTHSYGAGAPIMFRFTIQNRTAGSITFTGNNTSAAVSSNGEYFWIDKIGSDPLVITADGVWDGEITLMIEERPTFMEIELSSANYHDAITPYAKTGPLEIAVGERRAHVTSVLPDEGNSGDLDLRFYTREYPTSSETSHGPYDAANPTDVRFSGRQFTMRVEPNTLGSDWRSGTHRLKIVPGGRR